MGREGALPVAIGHDAEQHRLAIDFFICQCRDHCSCFWLLSSLTAFHQQDLCDRGRSLLSPSSPLAFSFRSPTVMHVRGSIVVSIPACHAGNRGSIPRRGVTLFLLPTRYTNLFFFADHKRRRTINSPLLPTTMANVSVFPFGRPCQATAR